MTQQPPGEETAGQQQQQQAASPEPSVTPYTPLIVTLGVTPQDALVLTWANPHVYLDTVILVGSIANARPQGEQVPFATGASFASFVWFFAIGYGATALRPWLSRPAVWRGIDFAIAAIMFALAAKLLIG